MDRQSFPITKIKRDAFQWRAGYNGLPALDLLLRPGISPSGAGRQINFSFGNAGAQHGCDKQIRAEHELIIYVLRFSVAGEIKEERAHRRRAFFRSEFHLTHDVRAQTFAQEK